MKAKIDLFMTGLLFFYVVIGLVCAIAVGFASGEKEDVVELIGPSLGIMVFWPFIAFFFLCAGIAAAPVYLGRFLQRRFKKEKASKLETPRDPSPRPSLDDLIKRRNR